MKTISVAVACSNPIDMYFPFKELLLSINDLADEVVILNCDSDEKVIYGDSQVDIIIDEVQKKYDFKPKLKIYYLPWQEHMMKNMEMLAKTAAISQCSCDYVLLLDADEIIHEEDIPKIKRLVELDKGSYSFRTIHFYKDYESVIDSNKTEFYNHRPKLFRNFEGTFDGYQSWCCTEYGTCGLETEYTADLVTWDYISLTKLANKTKVNIYHYGWVRPDDVMLHKQNTIDNRYHRNFSNRSSWNWDMSVVKAFEGTHPKVMKERIEKFK